MRQAFEDAGKLEHFECFEKQYDKCKDCNKDCITIEEMFELIVKLMKG